MRPLKCRFNSEALCIFSLTFSESLGMFFGALSLSAKYDLLLRVAGGHKLIPGLDQWLNVKAPELCHAQMVVITPTGAVVLEVGTGSFLGCSTPLDLLHRDKVFSQRLTYASGLDGNAFAAKPQLVTVLDPDECVPICMSCIPFPVLAVKNSDR